MNDWFTFFIASLATYRLSLLVSKEDGPAWIFRKLRNVPPKKSSAREGVRCEWCVSVYASALVTWFTYPHVTLYWAILYWLALSAAAICWNQAFTKK